MGRPRKPIAVHEASGAISKDPQRFRDRMDEPRPSAPLGSPPAHFLNAKSPTSLALLAIWRRLEKEVPEGALTSSDNTAFANLCTAQLQIERNPLDTPASILNTSLAYLDRFGLNPHGRTRIAIRKAKEVDSRTPDGWAALAEERAAVN